MRVALLDRAAEAVGAAERAADDHQRDSARVSPTRDRDAGADAADAASEGGEEIRELLNAQHYLTLAAANGYLDRYERRQRYSQKRLKRAGAGGAVGAQPDAG